MQPNWIEAQNARQHAKDLVREAELLRTVDVLAGGRPKSGPHYRALVWLGSQLIAWGWRLRVRYGAVEHEPAV